MHILIPNGPELTKNLTTLGIGCDAVEVILFERTTFLLIARSEQSAASDDPADDPLMSSSYDLSEPSTSSSPVVPSGLSRTRPQPNSQQPQINGSAVHLPTNRFEQTSSLIKAFKLSCLKSGMGQFQAMEMRLPNYTAVLDVLTSNSYILIVTDNLDIR